MRKQESSVLDMLDPIERRAYHLDVMRAVPRLTLGLYIAAAYYVGWWFMGLKDATGAQAAFVSTVWGVMPLMLNFYAQNGVDWAKRIDDRFSQMAPPGAPASSPT